MDSLVTKRIQWPREMVFTSQGQPQVYWEMSLALFINGYLSVLAEESDTSKTVMLQHLQELLEDTEVYGWRVVRGYHAVSLQQIEQGQAARRMKAKRSNGEGC